MLPNPIVLRKPLCPTPRCVFQRRTSMAAITGRCRQQKTWFSWDGMRTMHSSNWRRMKHGFIYVRLGRRQGALHVHPNLARVRHVILRTHGGVVAPGLLNLREAGFRVFTRSQLRAELQQHAKGNGWQHGRPMPGKTMRSTSMRFSRQPWTRRGQIRVAWRRTDGANREIRIRSAKQAYRERWPDVSLSPHSAAA